MPRFANLLDVRPTDAFLAGHHAEAAHVPLEELAARVHELPSPDAALVVYDACRIRARWAASRLRARGRLKVTPIWGDALAPDELRRTGPATVRLWRPHALLIEALSFFRDSRFAIRHSHPPRALDLASGTGRDAVHLALAGFDVDALDILPDALVRCADLAARHGASVRTICRDVEAHPDLGAAVYDLICVFNYLHRPLLPRLAAAIRPGGWVVYETFLVGQRERFGKPKSDAYLLQPGELRAAFDGWEAAVYREGLAGPRRFVASLIARKTTDD